MPTQFTGPMRTRVAPSPTGYIHIGTLSTLLYDYFLARQSQGQFIVRIEDTDRDRLVPGAIESLLKTFATLGIDYDEGPVLNADGSVGQKGNSGPYIQSERLSIYKPYVEQLVDAGHAYPCFCSTERLAKMREDQMALKQAPKYDRLCLKLSTDEVKAKLAAGEPHVIRMKIPEGESTFVDGIRGAITFKNAEIDDQILWKSDGFPTYHLAVVIDDHLMNITHVLRGEEWISSTPKQIILHKMLGWDMPVYAHVPLILNPDKTKLSKRKGDVSVESYLQKGYLPAALINFLALLGWNPTSDREIFSVQELISLFDLAKVNKSGAVLNVEKLNWTNAHYIKALSVEEYVNHCKPYVEDLSKDQDFVQRACLLVRDRLQLFSELPGLIQFLFKTALEHDASIIPWKKQSREDALNILKELRETLAAKDQIWFTEAASIETDLRALIAANQWKNGEVFWPLRVALSGLSQSPGPVELLIAYGKDRALARIDEAIQRMS